MYAGTVNRRFEGEPARQAFGDTTPLNKHGAALFVFLPLHVLLSLLLLLLLL